jgi:hypothetical protein
VDIIAELGIEESKPRKPARIPREALMRAIGARVDWLAERTREAELRQRCTPDLTALVH